MIKIRENDLKKIIAEVSVGNESVLEQFYDEYGKMLFALIFSIVKNRESAEEVLQDVLIAMVTHPPYKPIANAKGWLFRVIENISKKKAAEDIARQADLLKEDEDALSYDLPDNIENTIDQIESLKILDELEKQFVIMRVYGNMKLPQIARYSGMTYDKVRARYDYAIKKLKKYYEERKNNYE